MYPEMFETYIEQAEKAFAPYVKFNQLITKNIEGIVELQLNAMHKYRDIGLSQLKATGEVKDVQSLVACNNQQLENLTKLSQQMNDDSHQLTAMTQKFIKDVDHLIAENAKASL
ncbi:phasin family protein [Photobacterium lipolyticum]|uniref:Phasin family protein n=1 Tax=Photobacterium lipolyticum TaxID=266810 RepID=A0A2T3N4L3_9GAMM|nr:phasin family protein [Photobacterium lipolyticum]PSW07382.1 phasin family protein [Photobacterium lipolyticum]